MYQVINNFYIYNFIAELRHEPELWFTQKCSHGATPRVY